MPEPEDDPFATDTGDPFADHSLGIEEWNGPEDDPFADSPAVAAIVFPDSTGNLEADCTAEVEAVASALGARKLADEARRAAATDGDFYVSVVFQSREEVQEFMRMCMCDTDVRYLAGSTLAAIVRQVTMKG